MTLVTPDEQTSLRLLIKDEIRQHAADERTRLESLEARAERLAEEVRSLVQIPAHLEHIRQSLDGFSEQLRSQSELVDTLRAGFLEWRTMTRMAVFLLAGIAGVLAVGASIAQIWDTISAQHEVRHVIGRTNPGVEQYDYEPLNGTE